MTDWRAHFPDDSRVSWDRRVAEATGPLWPLARPFVEAWRLDSTLPLARSMEGHFRGSAHAVPADDAEALEAATAAVRELFRQAGLARLRLYRGQPAGVDWKWGEEIDLVGRGLTAWSPLREVAIGHAARRRPGAVLVTDASVDQVALAFDPSSDAEIVLLGVVTATIDTLIP